MRKVIYILVVSSFLLSIQPALAQTYYFFGPAGSGITWSDIWKFGRNPSVIGAPQKEQVRSDVEVWVTK